MKRVERSVFRARRGMRAFVIASALALGVGALAGVARAEPAPPPPPAPAASGSPLALRPSRPLETAPAEPPASSAAWKLIAIAALLGGGVWAYRKRMKAASPEVRGQIHIVTRKAIGMRSELVIVEVDGASLLLGVTPSSIQMVTTLEDRIPAPARAFAEPPPEREPAPVLEARPRKMTKERPVERQIRGLLTKTRGVG